MRLQLPFAYAFILWEYVKFINRLFFNFFRLQYFARGLQVYIRQLRLALQGKTGEALKTEEVSIVQEF